MEDVWGQPTRNQELNHSNEHRQTTSEHREDTTHHTDQSSALSNSNNEHVQSGNHHGPTRSEINGMQRAARIFGFLAFFAWLASFVCGIYGFYVGMNTAEFDDSDDPICFPSDHGTCAVTTKKRALCVACHRAKVDLTMILISIYMVLFGFIGMSGTCGYSLGGNFGFLKSRFGRGFFLFFIGTLAVTEGSMFEYSEIFTLLVGVADTIIGFGIMITSCCAEKSEEDHEENGHYSRMQA